MSLPVIGPVVRPRSVWSVPWSILKVCDPLSRGAVGGVSQGVGVCKAEPRK